MDPSIENQPTKQNPTNLHTKKIITAITLVCIISLVIIDSLTNQCIKQGIDIFLEWIENNPIPGVFAFIVVYFIATVLFIPGSILTLGCGFIFANVFGLGLGVVLASIAVFIGASSGAIAAFLLGRYLLRDWVLGLTAKYPLFEAVDAALEDKGFRIMCLLRLSPIIPFNALNYISGVTAISLTAYAWAMIAILPGTILYVFLGATAGSLTDSSSSGDAGIIKIITIIFGVVFGILGVAAISYYAKKELDNVIQRQSNDQGCHFSIQEDVEIGENYDNELENTNNQKSLLDNEESNIHSVNNLQQPFFSSNVKSYQ